MAEPGSECGKPQRRGVGYGRVEEGGDHGIALGVVALRFRRAWSTGLERGYKGALTLYMRFDELQDLKVLVIGLAAHCVPIPRQIFPRQQTPPAMQ